MRSLVVIFFFFVLIFGFGTIVFSAEFQENPTVGDSGIVLGQVTTGTNQATTVSTVVDLDGDSEAHYPCTPAPNDCNLRSAINIANSDGKPTAINFAGNYMITLSHPLPTLSEDHTTLKGLPGQEIHINGNGTAGSVLRITGAHMEIEGLRIYGSGIGYPNLTISEAAYDVLVANNVIGDDDAPSGNCGSSEFSYGGIYIDATGDFDDGVRARIFGNIIECNRGIPGDGITIRTDKVIVGKDQRGIGNDAQRNVISMNSGFGVNLTDTTGNTVCDNDLIENVTGALYISNFHNNNIMYNNIVDHNININ